MATSELMFPDDDNFTNFVFHHANAIRSNVNLDEYLLSSLKVKGIISPLEYAKFKRVTLPERAVDFVDFLTDNPQRMMELEKINTMISVCQSRQHPRPTIEKVFQAWKVSFQVSSVRNTGSGARIDWMVGREMEETNEPVDLSKPQNWRSLKEKLYAVRAQQPLNLRRGSTICFLWSAFKNPEQLTDLEPNEQLMEPIRTKFQELTSAPVDIVSNSQSESAVKVELTSFKARVIEENPDYLVVILSSHGNNRWQLYTSNGNVIDLVRHVIHVLDGDNFSGFDPQKPRIYLCDACQSDNTQVAAKTMINQKGEYSDYSCKSPFIVFFSTIPTEVALYNILGSHFLRAVCSKFERKIDFFSLFNQVQDDVDRRLEPEPHLRQSLGCWAVRMSPLDLYF